MRLLLTIVLIFSSLTQFSQVSPFGNFSDYFGNKLELKKDSGFIHTYRVDTYYSWSLGTWTRIGDTVILNLDTVFDILNDIESAILDSVVISANPISDTIDNLTYSINSIGPGGQHSRAIPKKLVYLDNKLYLLKKDNSIDFEIVEAWFDTRKKFPTYYERTN